MKRKPSSTHPPLGITLTTVHFTPSSAKSNNQPQQMQEQWREAKSTREKGVDSTLFARVGAEANLLCCKRCCQRPFGTIFSANTCRALV